MIIRNSPIHNEAIFSRSRHDYVTSGSAMIDGGRSYTRRSGLPLKLRVEYGELKVTEVGRFNYETYMYFYNLFAKFPTSIRYGCISILGKLARRKA